MIAMFLWFVCAIIQSNERKFHLNFKKALTNWKVGLICIEYQSFFDLWFKHWKVFIKTVNSLMWILLYGSCNVASKIDLIFRTEWAKKGTIHIHIQPPNAKTNASKSEVSRELSEIKLKAVYCMKYVIHLPTYQLKCLRRLCKEKLMWMFIKKQLKRV